jgi:hypothetical protein
MAWCQPFDAVEELENAEFRETGEQVVDWITGTTSSIVLCRTNVGERFW